ncbi:amino acid-binding protein [candidate division KSB1 bacterium]|nr:amino acid-binding protein [candidate division KSB1 bacterium]
MRVKQISIFMENRAGRLEEITEVLRVADVNIRALSLADTSDFGILRIIVDKPKEAVEKLRNEGFTVRENDVIACVVDDHPGGLHQILNILAQNNISVEYMYGLLERHTDKAVMIMRIEELDIAVKALLSNNIDLLPGEEVYRL